MKTGSLAALVALGAALTVSPLAGDDDTKAKKTDTPGMEKVTVYSVRCEEPCPFTVQSTDKQEVVDIVTDHARRHHNMSVTAKDVEAMIQTREMMVRTDDPMKHPSETMKKPETPEERPRY